MNLGDVVFTKSLTAQFAGARVRGSSVWKANKGKLLVTLVLGACDEKAMHDFDAVAALKAMGWTPPTEFAAPTREGVANGRPIPSLPPAEAPSDG